MQTLNFSAKLNHEGHSISMILNMYLFKEEKSYIVYCPSLDISASGDSEEQAKKYFEEVLFITFKYMLNKNTLKADLMNHGWGLKSLKQKKMKAPSLQTMLRKNDSFREILENKEYVAYKQNIDIPQFS